MAHKECQTNKPKSEREIKKKHVTNYFNSRWNEEKWAIDENRTNPTTHLQHGTIEAMRNDRKCAKTATALCIGENTIFASSSILRAIKQKSSHLPAVDSINTQMLIKIDAFFSLLLLPHEQQQQLFRTEFAFDFHFGSLVVAIDLLLLFSRSIIAQFYLFKRGDSRNVRAEKKKYEKHS